jgi:hypothetical protein
MQIATPLACSLALAVGAAVLTACDPSVPAADPPLADPYDVGKMTLKSAPAGDGSPGGDEDRQPLGGMQHRCSCVTLYPELPPTDDRPAL